MMKDYKYIVFDRDIKIYPAEEILYHKNQIYEIAGISGGDKGHTLLVQTKNPEMIKYVDENSTLLTTTDLRKLKLEIIKSKI